MTAPLLFWAYIQLTGLMPKRKAVPTCIIWESIARRALTLPAKEMNTGIHSARGNLVSGVALITTRRKSSRPEHLATNPFSLGQQVWTAVTHGTLFLTRGLESKPM